MKISTTLTILAAVTYGSAQTNINPQDALRLAAKNRRSLQAAKLFLDESRAKSRALGAYASTVIGIGASTRSDVGATDGDLYLSQPIDLFGKRDANQRIGNAGVQLALATYFAVARDLQTEVLTAFAETSTARARSEVAGELLNVAERLFAATKRRFDEGNVAETQVTRASIELARAKQAKDLFASQYIRSLTRLASLLGTESNEITVEPDSDIRPPDAATFESRPDLLTLNAELQIAEAEIQSAKVSSRPDLSIQLVRTPWNNEPASFVGRAQLTWSIFDHGRLKNEGRAATLRAEGSKKSLADATAMATKEAATAQMDVAAARIQHKSYEAILVSSKELVAKSQRGFVEGLGSQIDVLEATRALREIQQEIILAKQQLSLAVIAQYRACGFLSEVLK